MHFLAILLRTHKRPKALRTCLASLNKQARKNLVVILISDCNEDNIENTAFQYPELSILTKHVEPLGYPACNLYFNQVKDLVTAEYVLFLDDDDIMVGETCSKELEDFAVKNNHPAVIMSRVHYPGRRVPQDEHWKKYPTIYHLSGTNFCIRNDIYKKHDWPGVRSGDFYYIDTIFKNINWKTEVCWFDRTIANITRTGAGTPELGE